MSKRKLKKNKNIFHNNTPLTQNDDTDTKSKIYDISQTARWSGLSKSHIRKIIKEGEFKDVYKDGNKYMIVYDSFMEYIYSKYGNNTTKEQVNSDVTEEQVNSDVTEVTEDEDNLIDINIQKCSTGSFLEDCYELSVMTATLMKNTCMKSLKNDELYRMLLFINEKIDDMLLTYKIQADMYNEENLISYADISKMYDMDYNEASVFTRHFNIKPIVRKNGRLHLFDKNEVIETFKQHNFFEEVKEHDKLHNQD